jgi:hypothetical protein
VKLKDTVALAITEFISEFQKDVQLTTTIESREIKQGKI